MKKIFLISMIIFSHKSFSQTWAWCRSGGSSGNYENGQSIVADSLGNVYVTGTFNSTAIFGNDSFPTYGGNDIFIAKYDSYGNKIWVKHVGGPNTDHSYGIVLDNQSAFYITGNVSDTVFFGNDTIYGINGAFIAKFDTSGNFMWLRKVASLPVISYGLARDLNFNLYITGHFWGSVVIGGDTLPALGGEDIFIAKFDSSGNYLWAKHGGGYGDDIGYGIAVGTTGCYITGMFHGTATFDNCANCTIVSASVEDVFIVKYDSSGNPLWARGEGGGWTDYGFGIAVDNNENIYVTGFFQDVITFGLTPALISDGWAEDIFIVKYDSSGNALWSHNAGGNWHDQGCAIAVDNASNCYVTGNFSGPANFSGDTLQGSTSFDVFVAKYDSLGNLEYARQASGPLQAYGYGICADALQNCYVTGGFSGTAYFGNNTVTSNGSQDIFIAKLNNINVGTFEIPADKSSVYIFPNPSNSELLVNGFFSSAAKQVIIYNTLGEEVLIKTFKEGEKKIKLNIKNLLSGIYFITITDEKGNKTTRKFIKM